MGGGKVMGQERREAETSHGGRQTLHFKGGSKKEECDNGERKGRQVEIGEE